MIRKHPRSHRFARAAALALALFAICLAAALPGPVQAQQVAAREPTACAALVGHDFSTVNDAPSLVVSAVVKPAGDELPRHCLVDGQIAPTIGYRMWLPMADWNGKFVQAGCGGRCGWILDDGCQIVLMRGYACLAADLGHKGTMYDNLWAIDNAPGEIDFGFRATHVANLTGKAVLAQFYGRAARLSYYIGASTGGRQGLIEAQRFPQDFDGIIAGEPAMGTPGTAQPEVGPRLVDAVRALSPNGEPLLTPAELLALNRQAIARCDMDDGLKDGFISDPNRCDFAPAQLLCKGQDKPASDAAPCLNARQVEALEQVYAAGARPGSEKAWIGAYVQKTAAWAATAAAGATTTATPMPGSSTTPPNPDLRAFKAGGGKLILYQGWADEATFPNNPVLYYETVERLMGGRAATQSFFRLFMIPGQKPHPGQRRCRDRRLPGLPRGLGRTRPAARRAAGAEAEGACPIRRTGDLPGLPRSRQRGFRAARVSVPGAGTLSRSGRPEPALSFGPYQPPSTGR